MKNNPPQRGRNVDLGPMRHVPALATALVAVSSAILAAVATSDMALHSGAVSDPRLAWLVPAVIEGGAVCAGLLAWQRTAQGVGAWPERIVLMLLTGLAVTANAAHATTTGSVFGTNSDTLGVILSASPPLILVGVIELRLRALSVTYGETKKVRVTAPAQSGRAVRGDSQARALTSKPKPPAIERSDRTNSDQPRSPRSVSRASDQHDERKAIVVSMLAENPDVTGAQVGEVLGVSAATGRRLLAKIREEDHPEAVTPTDDHTEV